MSAASTPTPPDVSDAGAAASGEPNPNPTTTLAVLQQDDAGGEKDASAEIGAIFSTRRPRNLSAGMSSGLKSVAKGTAMGAVGLVAAPVLGAKESGIKGFCLGLGAGILGALTLPTYGLIVGSVQVARGALNTPESIIERNKGKIWDEDTRMWVSYDLPEEAREVLAQTEEEWCATHGVGKGGGKREGGSTKAGDARAVKERELYDALGVDTDATGSQIKKAYFKLAKELRPDKNLGDPHAHDKFQKVGEAYQVLSNDELRAKYDTSGKAALEASNLVDPTSFFAMLFGSEPFEHLTGELRLATLFSMGGEVNEAFLAFKQKRREVLCAITLSGLLRQFEHGDEAEFESDMHIEAQALVKAPVGVALIWTCGYIYENKGLQALGGLDGVASNARQTVHAAASNMRVAATAIKTYRAFKKEMKKSEKDDLDKEGGEGGSSASAVDDAVAGGGASSSSSAGGGAVPDETVPVTVGQPAVIVALKARPELNGYTGMVVGWNEEKSRWMIQLDETGEQLLLRPANVCSVAGGGGKKGGDDGGGPSEDTMYLMLESMWRVSLLDIEATLRHACNKVLSDQSTTKEARRARARGLVVMGRVFQSYGSADAIKSTNFAEHMQQVGERMAQSVAEQHEKQAAAEGH